MDNSMTIPPELRLVYPEGLPLTLPKYLPYLNPRTGIREYPLPSSL